MKQMALFLACFFILGAVTEGCATTQSEIREISVNVMVPDMGWKIEIREVYRVGEELWVVSALDKEPGMAADMMTTVSDSVRISAPDFPVKIFVSGKTWEWDNTEPYVFIKDVGELEEKLKKGERIFFKAGK